MKRSFFFGAALIGALLFLAGCSGSSINGNTARLRALNAIPNGGQATVFVNNGSTNGTQAFLQSTPYLFLNTGLSTFAFSLTIAASGVTSPTYTIPLSPGCALHGAPAGTLRSDDGPLGSAFARHHR